MGLLDNAITVEEFQKRKKESLAKSRFKETGSVMSRPISEEWQPDNVRHGGHALEAPMFSPDDLIGSGIFSKLGLLATSAAPALASGLLGVVAKNKGVSTMPSKIARALDKQAGTIAWHGSPHKFDKFDMSKIGTGEGAQAYGHGLYMAESPKVAKGYQKSTSYQEAVRQFRNELPDDADFSEIVDIAKNGGVSPPMARVINELQNNDWLGYDYPAQAITGAFKHGKSHDMTPELQSAINEYGQLYKVDIPDEAVAKFLDWDKPLSEQAPEVQNILLNHPDIVDQINKAEATRIKLNEMSPLRLEKIPSASKPYDASRMTGNDALVAIQQRSAAGIDGGAEKTLKDLGIPGIRYLDGGSRSAGQGSSNYVLFDDQLPRILERNGQPTGLQPWAKGEWKGLLDEPAPKLTEFEQRHLTAQKNAALPVEQGGLGLPPNNTAMDRAAILFPESGFHATGADIKSIDESKVAASDYGTIGQGFYIDPREGAGYSNLVANINANKAPQNIMPLRYSADNLYDVTDLVGVRDAASSAKLTRNLKDAGYSGTVSMTMDGLPNEVAIFDPSKVRSRFAAFDPKRRHEADLLGYADPYLLGSMGAGGLLGMGGYSMMNDK